MKKMRLVLAGAALTAAVAPVTATPAQAMTCADGFDVLCDVIALTCRTINDLPTSKYLACAPLG